MTQSAYEASLERTGHCDDIELDCGHMGPAHQNGDCDECAMEGRVVGDE